jgi:TonB family protein
MHHRIASVVGVTIFFLAAASLTSNAQRVVDTPPGALIQRKVYPVYPYEARNEHLAGSGVVLLNVDPRTGYVTSARMLKSTGYHILDQAALDARRQWRFKPGTVRKMRIPFTFTLTGVKY